MKILLIISQIIGLFLICNYTPGVLKAIIHKEMKCNLENVLMFSIGIIFFSIKFIIK